LATIATTDTFETEVIKSDGKVIVDFWAEWCGPCHAVSPVLDRIADEHQVKIVKVNIDEQQDLAQRYGVLVDPVHGPVRGRRSPGICRRGLPEGRAREDVGAGGGLGLPAPLLRLVEERLKGDVLGEVRLERLDAVGCELLDPRLRQVVLDPVQEAVIVHAGIIDPLPDVHMSHSAHLAQARVLRDEGRHAPLRTR